MSFYSQTMLEADPKRVVHNASDQPKGQFSLAQLLAIVFACGAFLALVRIIYRMPQVSYFDWALVIGGGIASVAVFSVVKMRLAAEISIIMTAFVVFLAAWAMSIPIAQGAARRSVCQGYLKQIVVALHFYHDEYGCFPPAVVRDASGRPMHSWRVLLLPYMEQQAIYAKYRFDEPWDGPNNRKLHDTEANLFTCPEQSAGARGNRNTDTSYVVIVGPRTAFPEDRCVALRDITDDQGNTLLVVEIAGSGIHWMEPRDLHVTQMARQINPPRGQGISSAHGPHPPGGANVVMVDGTLKFLDAKSLTADQVEGLLTIAGGEKVKAP